MRLKLDFSCCLSLLQRSEIAPTVEDGHVGHCWFFHWTEGLAQHPGWSGVSQLDSKDFWETRDASSMPCFPISLLPKCSNKIDAFFGDDSIKEIEIGYVEITAWRSVMSHLWVTFPGCNTLNLYDTEIYQYLCANCRTNSQFAGFCSMTDCIDRR